MSRYGDLFWVDFGGVRGSEPAGRRPALVLQSDRFNVSTIETTIVAALTTNLRLGDAPGNVRLPRGEGGLPRASVVNLSQIRTVNKSALRARIGRLAHARLTEVAANLRLVLVLD